MRADTTVEICGLIHNDKDDRREKVHVALRAVGPRTLL